MNCYTTIEEVSSELSLTVGLSVIEAISREIDALCMRHFYTRSGIEYYTPADNKTLFLNDVLSISELVIDSAIAGTYTEKWTEDEDFVLSPFSEWPKVRLDVLPWGDYAFPVDQFRAVKITGVWGYGDGESVSPWTASGITGTLADAADTSMAISAEDVIETGDTLLIGSEQVFVTAVTTNDSKIATVERGMNGTTAAAHSAAACSVAAYPPDLKRAALWFVRNESTAAARAGYESQRAGDYSYKLQSPKSLDEVKKRILGRFIKL